MDINLTFFILSFSSLFTLINPIGILPIVLSITEGSNNKEYYKIITKAILFSLIILMLFAFMGRLIFSFYGITIHAFKIAGGILFLRTGLDMLYAKTSRTKTTPQEEKEANDIGDISIAPIGIPLIAGPGAITSVMLLSYQANTFNERKLFYLIIIFVLCITYFILKLAKKISKRFGTTGIRIIQRIMGLILMVLAIQFIINGVDPIVKGWISTI